MAEPVNNSGASRNPTGRAGKKPGEKRNIQKQTAFNEAEEERINWAREKTGLDWASFLRFAALKVTEEVIG